MRGKLREILGSREYLEVASDRIGTVYKEIESYPFLFVVARGPRSICCYIGMRRGTAISEMDSDILGEMLELHGGVTYNGPSLPERIRENMKHSMASKYDWIGWDHAHFGDIWIASEGEMQDELMKAFSTMNVGERNFFTIDECVSEAIEANRKIHEICTIENLREFSFPSSL